METAKKNVAVLATCQALLFTNNSTAIALNGLAGHALAADKALATLPVIFVAMATSSFSSGLLLEKSGWQILNYLALPFVTAAAIAVLWLLARRRVAAGV